MSKFRNETCAVHKLIAGHKSLCMTSGRFHALLSRLHSDPLVSAETCCNAELRPAEVRTSLRVKPRHASLTDLQRRWSNSALCFRTARRSQAWT